MPKIWNYRAVRASCEGYQSWEVREWNGTSCPWHPNNWKLSPTNQFALSLYWKGYLICGIPFSLIWCFVCDGINERSQLKAAHADSQVCAQIGYFISKKRFEKYRRNCCLSWCDANNFFIFKVFIHKLVFFLGRLENEVKWLFYLFSDFKVMFKSVYLTADDQIIPISFKYIAR